MGALGEQARERLGVLAAQQALRTCPGVEVVRLDGLVAVLGAPVDPRAHDLEEVRP